MLDKDPGSSIGAGYVGRPDCRGATRRWVLSLMRSAAIASGLAIVFGSEFVFTLLGVDDPACCLVALASVIAGWSALASGVMLLRCWRGRGRDRGEASLPGSFLA